MLLQPATTQFDDRWNAAWADDRVLELDIPLDLRQIFFKVKGRVKYERERGDVWQSPYETWSSKKGDCEDFALLWAYILKLAGYDGDLISVQIGRNNRNRDHAICCYNDEAFFDVAARDLLNKRESGLIFKPRFALYLNGVKHVHV